MDYEYGIANNREEEETGGSVRSNKMENLMRNLEGFLEREKAEEIRLGGGLGWADATTP